MTIINKLTKDLINKIITEFKKDENRNKINEEVLHPIIYYISEYINCKLYPFFIFGSIIFISTFIFAFIIMIMVIRLNLKK